MKFLLHTWILDMSQPADNADTVTTTTTTSPNPSITIAHPTQASVQGSGDSIQPATPVVYARGCGYWILSGVAACAGVGFVVWLQEDDISDCINFYYTYNDPVVVISKRLGMLGLVAMCTWILIDRTLTTHKANFDKVFYGFTAVAFLLLAEMNEYLEPRFDHFVVLAVRLLLAGVVARVTLAVLTVDDGQGSCASIMRFFKPWVIKKSLLPTAHVQPEARDHVRVQVEPSPCAPDSAKPGRNSFKSICGKLIAILLVLIGIFAFINLVGLILHHYHNDYVLEGYDVEGSVVSIDPDCFRL